MDLRVAIRSRIIIIALAETCPATCLPGDLSPADIKVYRHGTFQLVGIEPCDVLDRRHEPSGRTADAAIKRDVEGEAACPGDRDRVGAASSSRARGTASRRRSPCFGFGEA